MCKVYNSVACLTAIKKHLHECNISEFKSLREVIQFQKNFPSLRQNIISQHQRKIEKEKEELISHISYMEDIIEKDRNNYEQQLQKEILELKSKTIFSSNFSASSPIEKIIRWPQKILYKWKVLRLEKNINKKVEEFIETSVQVHQEKMDRLQYIRQNFDNAVMESAAESLMSLEYKYNIISGLESYIHGALGEFKVVKTLETLSDEYVLINDFKLLFHNPIYNHLEKKYIQSIQIDHLLVAPSGVFLIETKNWSKKSLHNLDLYSPVQQVKRANFAFYRILNQGIVHRLSKHHWGDRKIPLRNIIVMINSKPKEEFQHVKVLTLDELIGFITYLDPIFSQSEVRRISDYILDLSRFSS
ncbi:nuclease-related domain-containing protein [Niabella digestorum]|uniref:Nuclease-related domain-containing protein n=1 Tax=Niabella digestorum TaxID=3117701 RepID=A0ABU7RK21_9BACT